MSLLDIYNEHGIHLGTADRKEVHEKGLWHKTIHCWLVTNRFSLLFQQRSHNIKDNPGKLYTTASGHLDAGETMEQAFSREIFEELGVTINLADATLLFSEEFKADLIKTDGAEYHDRVWASRYIAKTNLPLTDLNFQTEEIDGMFEIDLRDLKDLNENKKTKINAIVLYKENNVKKTKTVTVSKQDFLVPPEHTFNNVVGRIVYKAIDFLQNQAK